MIRETGAFLLRLAEQLEKGPLRKGQRAPLAMKCRDYVMLLSQVDDVFPDLGDQVVEHLVLRVSGKLPAAGN